MRRTLLFVLLVVAFAGANALDITVSTDFSNLHAAAETSARLKVCSGLSGGPSATADDTVKKIECVKYLVDPSAACNANGLSSTCTVNGVTLLLADVTFVCDGGEYNDGNVQTVASPTCMMDDAGFTSYLTGAAGLPVCPAANADSGTNGGYTASTGGCSISARCHLTNDATATEFGDFCPATSGTTCCGEGIVVAVGAFPSNTPTTTEFNLTRLEIDHVVDLDISITYDLQAGVITSRLFQRKAVKGFAFFAKRCFFARFAR